MGQIEAMNVGQMVAVPWPTDPFRRFSLTHPSCFEGHFPLQSAGHGKPGRQKGKIGCQTLEQIHGSVVVSEIRDIAASTSDSFNYPR